MERSAFIVGINVGDKDDYVVLCFSKSRRVWLTGKLSGMYIGGIIIIMELLLVASDKNISFPFSS